MCDYRGNMRALLRKVFDAGYEAGRADVLKAERELEVSAGLSLPGNVVRLDTYRLNLLSRAANGPS